VNAYEYGFVFLPRSLHEREVHFTAVGLFVSDELEMPILRRHVDLHPTAAEGFLRDAVLNKVLDRNEFQAETFRYLHEVGQPRQRAVFGHALNKHARRFAASKPREVDSRLRVPRPTQDAAALGLERKDVTGLAKVFRLRFGVDQRTDGL